MAKTLTHAAWTRVMIAGLAASGATCPASAQASRTVQGAASVRDRAQLRHPGVTDFSMEWSQRIHELRRDIARPQFEKRMLERRLPMAERAAAERERALVGPRVGWTTPKTPVVNRAGTGRSVAGGANSYNALAPAASSNDVSPAETGMPGGLYVPKSWGIVDTPQGLEIQVPYTFTEQLIDTFFFGEDVNEDSDAFNAAQGIPNALAVQLILEIDLDELQIDVDGDGTPETVALKFVGFNPNVHDRVVIWASQGIDPFFVPEFLALDPGNTIDGPACFNTVDGFGAPTLFDPEAEYLSVGTPIDADNDELDIDIQGNALVAERVVDHCTWSSVSSLTRALGFTLGLTWQQMRSDRDTYIEIFPERVITFEPTSGPIIFLNGNDTTAAPLTLAPLGPDTDGIPDAVPDGWVTFGEYDAFSIMHLDTFAMSSTGDSQTFFPEEIILGTMAVEIENQRRLDDNDADTVPIPGSPLSTSTDVNAGLSELVGLIGFVPEFSTGDIMTITEIFEQNRFFAGEDPRCPLDANRDRVTDFRDVLAFGDLMLADDAAADLNLNGFIDPGDLSDFLTAYQSGGCREDLDFDGVIANGFIVPDGCEFNIDRETTGPQKLDFQDRQAFVDLLFGQNGIPQNPATDLNFDGELNFDDYSTFINGGITAAFGTGTCREGADLLINGCGFDVDADGDQDFQDREAFALLVAAGDMVGDLNFNGLVDENDMLALFGTGTFAIGVCEDGAAFPETNGCPFDIDDDGFQDWDDIRAFEALLETGAPVSDFDFDGRFNFEDRNSFVAQFATGECRIGNGLPFSDGCAFDLNVDGRQDWNDRILYGDLLLANDLIVDRFSNNATGTGDGVIDTADFAAMAQATGAFAQLGACLPQGGVLPIGDGCGFDVNVDGVQNFLDVQAFSDLFALGHPAADLNGDGFVNDLDLDAFNDPATGYTNGDCVEGNTEPEDDGCPQDINGDGLQTPEDLVLFIDLYNEPNIAADFDGDGVLEIEDLQAFLAAFVPGFCSPEFPEPDPDNRPGTTQPIFEG
ncbi:MAG: GC-type dockerin domain-anchored protein [Planctomycetota bacterium]